MRFHATTKTAEGQCYAALQQGVPRQPGVPLLLYLPPHKAGSCRAMCEPESPLCGTPWQCLLAPPLCRCQEERGLQSALCLHASDVRRVFIATIKVICCVYFSNSKCASGSLCMCFQRMGACHTVNHRSPPPVDTAPLAQPPPRAQQGHVRPKVHDSHNSGPPQSMLNSWGPTDRDSSRGSYVSNSLF